MCIRDRLSCARCLRASGSERPSPGRRVYGEGDLGQPSCPRRPRASGRGRRSPFRASREQ
eukprot:3939413-Alexandrium_andersonii.AAC.1